MFKYQIQQDQSIKVMTDTAYPIVMGYFERMEDGYYHYWALKERQGYWSSQMLSELADELKKLNAEWDREVAKINSRPLSQIPPDSDIPSGAR